VPDGLSAQEYFDLGMKYKLVGWPELARESLNRASSLDPDGEAGKKSALYLASRLPRYPVASEAEKKNVMGYNLLMSGDIDGAKATFKELIEEFPDFEWPYGNLAGIYIQEKKPEVAKPLLERAVEINPCYINGWLQFASVYELEGNNQGVLMCLKQVESIDPDDDGYKLQIKRRQLVDELEARKPKPSPESDQSPGLEEDS
jgi:tetratricopeptide (TPR) repeat protein